MSFGGLSGCHTLSAFVHFRRSAMSPSRRRLPTKTRALFREIGVGLNRETMSSSDLQALRERIGTSLSIDATFDGCSGRPRNPRKLPRGTASPISQKLRVVSWLRLRKLLTAACCKPAF